MKRWDECDCEGSIFIRHILEHLRVGEDVVCTICKKTVTEIALEGETMQEHLDNEMSKLIRSLNKLEEVLNAK